MLAVLFNEVLIVCYLLTTVWRLQRAQDRLAQFVQVAALQGFARLAMPRQIERDNAAPGSERSLTHSVEDRVSPQRQLLLDALIRHRWKPGDAARSLGISRATLYRRVNLHGIEMPGKRRI